jgi:hypothetical protein
MYLRQQSQYKQRFWTESAGCDHACSYTVSSCQCSLNNRRCFTQYIVLICARTAERRCRCTSGTEPIRYRGGAVLGSGNAVGQSRCTTATSTATSSTVSSFSTVYTPTTASANVASPVATSSSTTSRPTFVSVISSSSVSRPTSSGQTTASPTSSVPSSTRTSSVNCSSKILGLLPVGC